MDEIPKDRLKRLITLAKQTPKNKKEELFYRLNDYVIATFAKNLKQDSTGKSWLILNGACVIGKSGNADLKKILSEGFTSFEQSLTREDDQDAAEGFLHCCHISYYNRFKEHFKESDQESILTFNGSPLVPTSEYKSLNYLSEQALLYTSYVLLNGEQDVQKAILNF